MSKIYITQSKLELVLTTTIPLASVDTVNIKYKKPSGATGELTGAVLDDALGTITWESPVSSAFDEAGDWSIWVKFNYLDTRVSFSEPFVLTVVKEGLR